MFSFAVVVSLMLPMQLSKADFGVLPGEQASDADTWGKDREALIRQKAEQIALKVSSKLSRDKREQIVHEKLVAFIKTLPKDFSGPVLAQPHRVRLIALVATLGPEYGPDPLPTIRKGMKNSFPLIVNGEVVRARRDPMTGFVTTDPSTGDSASNYYRMEPFYYEYYYFDY